MSLCTKCGLDMPVELCYERLGCQKCIVHLARLKQRERSKGPMAGYANSKEYYRARTKRTRRICQLQLEVWQDWVKKVPEDYHPLTEEEWQDALKYFDYKCAFCQLNDFEVRGMFLTVGQGGRYCNWNMIPLCMTCTHRSPNNKNPFRFMNRINTSTKSIGTTRRYSKKKLEKVIKYLEPILLVAANIGDLQKVQDTRNESVE